MHWTRTLKDRGYEVWSLQHRGRTIGLVHYEPPKQRWTAHHGDQFGVAPMTTHGRRWQAKRAVEKRL